MIAFGFRILNCSLCSLSLSILFDLQLIQCIVGLQVVLEAVAVHLGIHLRHIAGAEAKADLTLLTMVVGIHLEGAEADHTLLTTVGADHILHTMPTTDARRTPGYVPHVAGHQ